MNILAIDQSTGANGLTVLTESDEAVTRRWRASRMRSPELFRLLPEALAAAGLEPADISLFAVGLGPGSFTGIRAAVAAVQAMALPKRVPVAGFSSAEVIASEIAQSRDISHVCVVGDARRRRLWIARYNIEAQRPALSEEIHLIPVDELAAAILPGAIVVTPDWDRLMTVLPAQVPEHAELIQEAIPPDVERLVRLAHDAAASGEPSQPPVPIYLHPPVSRTSGTAKPMEVVP